MKHTIWHHLAMVLVSEAVNLIWLGVSVAIAVSGLAIIVNFQQPFFRAAVGLPIALMGAGVFLFKIHEIILVVVRPQRLRKMCNFCNRGNE